MVSGRRLRLAAALALGAAALLAPASILADPASMTREQIEYNAQSGVGYSYWWGHGRWDPDQLDDPGSCSGSCGSCSHCPSNTKNGPCNNNLAERGADCSGFVAKVWQVPSPSAVDVNSHPYSTWDFRCTQLWWSQINRGRVKVGDAAVYRVGGCPGSAGHILLYDHGDPWGLWTTWEARGCSYGIVQNGGRSIAGYQVIRRDEIVADDDQDGDGIEDGDDNCPQDRNAGQNDADGDGVGNACDNCRNDANPA
jgi:hypothetical protein